MNQYFSILFLQSFNLPSEPLPLPQIGNNKNVPSSGNGNERIGTGNIDHVYASNSHLSNITNNLNLNRQSQLQRSSSAGSGGWSGNDRAKQGAVDPLTALILPPKRPSANLKNVEIQRKRKQEAEDLNLNRQIDQSQPQRSSSAGSGGRGGKQGARLPESMMLPPIWPHSNMRNDLFEAPTKIVNGDNSVENVLGRFEHADRLPNCLGVDYEPPASPSGLIQIPQLLNLSMPKPPPGPQQNITVCHAYLQGRRKV